MAATSVFSWQAVRAGLLVGTLDILAASIHFYIKTGRSPIGVLNYVATGLMGKQALTGGLDMALLGLVSHFVVAFAFTFFFFWLVSVFPSLLKHRILAGLAYGAFIWSVMEFLVLPLTNVPPRSLQLSNSLIGMAILMVCIGLPLAFMATATRSKSAPFTVRR